MQLEITLKKKTADDVSTRDLSFLLHKHPDHVHERELPWGKGYIFYPEVEDERTTAVLYLDIDSVGLVRGKSEQGQALLAQYVNDRAYAANSFLSVALAKVFGQSLAGKSKDRQELADQILEFEARVTPIAVIGGAEIAERVFAPLGYEVHLTLLNDFCKDEFYKDQFYQNIGRQFYQLSLSGQVRLSDLLSHLYVLIPVLDNSKHYYVDRDEVDNLLAKGEGWLQSHPEKELITRRALKHRRSLANLALARLVELEGQEEEAEAEPNNVKEDKEQALEKPIRLHDIRLDTVASVLKSLNAKSVLDLGCGEGKLLKRLIKDKGFDRIVGVDASLATLERASEKLYLDKAGEKLRERVSLLQGSLTYADRRWQGFDAATLVEVIEHIDPPRLSALEQSVFGFARPQTVIVTTPNRDYNVLFETMPAGSMRHPDHRFEWSRVEFQNWAKSVAGTFGYGVEFQPLGPEHEEHGAPSQMGVFRNKACNT